MMPSCFPLAAAARSLMPPRRAFRACLLCLAALAPANAAMLSSGMDQSTRPGKDFFEYTNGTWLRDTAIPADRSSYGLDEEVSDEVQKRIAGLIRDSAASSPAAGSAARLVADFYHSVMDEAAIENRGMRPLRPTLRRIEAITNRTLLARFLGSTLRADVDILNSTQLYTDHFFGLWVAQDLDAPTHYAAFLVQGGLGMPDRDDYLAEDEKSRSLQQQYRDYIDSLLRLSGVDARRARAASAEIYALERRIATVHVSRSDTEDVQRGHNHWTVPEFTQRAPGMDWPAYFAGAGLGHQARFVVWQPPAVTGMAALVNSVPLATWKLYLRFHAADHVARFLPKAAVDARFAFYGKALSGAQQLPERWKRAVDYTNDALSDAVGQLYVQRYFSVQSRQHIEQLARSLIETFAARIDSLQWMAPATRAQAKAKLATLKVGVGYPDHWRDYAGLRIEPGDAPGNAERAELFIYQYHLAKLVRTQVDRDEWVMAPQEVNAVNLPAMNAMNFPAAVLQPPYFDPEAPAAANFGAVGAVIGHEISHSFDDQGAQFDATGRLRNWWTPQDYAHFKAASTRLARQFDGYRPFPDLAVNGSQTLSENIADLAGLAVAYGAFRASLGGGEARPIDGFNGDQQFFISYAQSWRGKSRDESLRQSIIGDGHAPRRYRALEVRNLDAWYEAFGVHADEPLYLPPAERVVIW